MTGGTTATIPIQSNGLSNESSGVRVEQKGFKPPTQPQANMLTKEMAEAAAKKYKKDQKKIQKACAAVDPQTRNASPDHKTCTCPCYCNIMWNKSFLTERLPLIESHPQRRCPSWIEMLPTTTYLHVSMLLHKSYRCRCCWTHPKSWTNLLAQSIISSR
jgi:hypothetical protein